MVDKESPSDRHNRLSGAFVTAVIRDVVDGGGGYAEVMVVLESVLLGTMLATHKVFKLTPAVSAGLVEDAVHQALVRFAKETR